MKRAKISPMTDSPADAIATLRIEIKDIEPLIWRRVAVRSSMNLMALHKVIQAAMGWLDYHRWELVVEERKYGILDTDRPHVKNGATTQLATILVSGMTEFGYVYDFGDNWEHRILHTNLVVFGGNEKAIIKFQRGFSDGEIDRPVQRDALVHAAKQLSYILKFTTYHRPYGQRGKAKSKALPLNPAEHYALVNWMDQHEFPDYLFLFNAWRRGAVIELGTREALNA